MVGIFLDTVKLSFIHIFTHFLESPVRTKPSARSFSQEWIYPYVVLFTTWVCHMSLHPTLILMTSQILLMESMRLFSRVKPTQAVTTMKNIILSIIIIYFENVAFFHTKLGLDVCPKVDNQTSGDTLQDSTQPPSGKIAISQLSDHGYWSEVSVAGCPSTPTGSDKGRDSGIWNIFSGSWIFASIPLLLYCTDIFLYFSTGNQSVYIFPDSVHWSKCGPSCKLKKIRTITEVGLQLNVNVLNFEDLLIACGHGRRGSK